ncbi:GNAT family N-acetyltransferase [Paenibacillus sp. NAIST15-1]|uniref:GNAT family N-acetyltransferase n=1 Tax=Paenibacillus sp. NAIST15-1 TaxID=1605994 RepID=UPI00086CBAC9|nr:hypothetical protein [Paenibacillus sp. NAIST15-1]GAV11836.1 GNAT family acetyltransferase [Paenibacillus sp. NAIST15-1]
MIYPELETERLSMRELTMEDADAVYRHFSIPEVTRFMEIIFNRRGCLRKWDLIKRVN